MLLHLHETIGKHPVLTVAGAMKVVLLRWPEEEGRRAALRSGQVARLLLVDQGAPPPDVADELEDWIRVPSSELDVQARVTVLDRRARARGDAVPSLDGDGVMRTGDGWVSLPPVEARLASALVERFGTVVSRDALTRSGWPENAPGRNALDVHVLRLRRRLAPLGLAIRTVRSRGYLLERTANGHGAV